MAKRGKELVVLVRSLHFCTCQLALVPRVFYCTRLPLGGVRFSSSCLSFTLLFPLLLLLLSSSLWTVSAIFYVGLGHWNTVCLEKYAFTNPCRKNNNKVSRTAGHELRPLLLPWLTVGPNQSHFLFAKHLPRRAPSLPDSVNWRARHRQAKPSHRRWCLPSGGFRSRAHSSRPRWLTMASESKSHRLLFVFVKWTLSSAILSCWAHEQ